MTKQILLARPSKREVKGVLKIEKKRMLKIVLGFSLLISLGIFSSVALSQPKPQTDCDRTCFENLMDNYLIAMRDQDSDNKIFEPTLKFTENGVRLPFGNEGLWFGMSGIANYKFYVPDLETRQVAFIGTVRENGEKSDDGDLVAVAIRLKLNGNNKISEIEQLVIRPSSVNSSQNDFPPTGEAVEAMGSPHKIFLEVIPEKERMSREELVIASNYYFSGLQRNDGKGYYPFTDDCVRYENGNFSTDECKKQFEESVRGLVSRIRDRRFVAVDRERGIAFAFGFFDHHSINWTWQLAELFKIENGQIRRIEAVFHRAAFGTNSGWSTYEQGMSEEVQSIK